MFTAVTNEYEVNNQRIYVIYCELCVRYPDISQLVIEDKSLSFYLLILKLSSLFCLLSYLLLGDFMTYFEFFFFLYLLSFLFLFFSLDSFLIFFFFLLHLQITLRYQLVFCSSRSSVGDSAAYSYGSLTGTVILPLYKKNVEKDRFERAVIWLGRDLQQILSYMGIEYEPKKNILYNLNKIFSCYSLSSGSSF